MYSVWVTHVILFFCVRYDSRFCFFICLLCVYVFFLMFFLLFFACLFLVWLVCSLSSFLLVPPLCLLKRGKEGLAFNWWGDGEDLEEDEGGEAMIRINRIKKQSKKGTSNAVLRVAIPFRWRVQQTLLRGTQVSAGAFIAFATDIQGSPWCHGGGDSWKKPPLLNLLETLGAFEVQGSGVRCA